MIETPVWDEVVRIIRETFGDETLQVGRDTTASDVAGWDSVSHIELLVALEQTFRVKFYTGEIAGLKNVGELADAITARLRRGEGGGAGGEARR